MPDKFEQYYKYLKANGADVAPDFNSFKNTLSDSNKASKYYSYLKENQFDVPETFDSFANTFGLKKKPAIYYLRVYHHDYQTSLIFYNKVKKWLRERFLPILVNLFQKVPRSLL